MNYLKDKIFKRVCHGFRLTWQDDYFWVTNDHFWNKRHFLRRLKQVRKSARAWNLTTSKFNQDKFVQILDTHSKILKNEKDQIRMLIMVSSFQNEFLKSLIQFSDNQTGNASSSVLINYRWKYFSHNSSSLVHFKEF